MTAIRPNIWIVAPWELAGLLSASALYLALGNARHLRFAFDVKH